MRPKISNSFSKISLIKLNKSCLIVTLITAFTWQVNAQPLNKYDLLITEIMSDPNPSVNLPDEEYLEIMNHSRDTIQLANIILHIGYREIIPDSLLLAPDSFYVFWDAEIPALKNSGDSIKITWNTHLIHKVNFKPSMHESDFKENGGWSLELVDPSKPCLTENNWQSSINNNGGTPGKPNSIFRELEVAEVSLTSYFPVNDTTLKLVFNTPVDSIHTENKLYVIEESIFVKVPKMDSNKLQSFVISKPTTCFSNSFKDLTIHYGLPNIPIEGNLIINEILFNPDPTGCDFIEIFNPTSKTFDISKLSFSRLDEEGQLEEGYPLFDIPKLILPKQHLVFCTNPNWVQSQFSNATNLLASNIPSLNNDEGSLVLINKAGEILDNLFYKEDWHYPELNDPENVSLEKIIPTGENTASNWTSTSSFEGFATPGYVNSNHETLPNQIKNMDLAYSVISPNGDGYHDQFILKYQFQTTDWTGSIDVINANGITIHSITSGALFSLNGVIQWDGYLNNGTLIKPGIYAVWVNTYNLTSQESKRKKITFYINGKLQ